MKNTKKTLLVFILGILIGVGTFVSFSKADTIENFLTDISSKTLGLRIGGDVAFEKDLYVGENVGIGTANPTEKLTVDGVIETSGGVKFGDGTTLESGDLGNSSPTTSTGDIIVNNGNGDTRLPVGSESQVLTVNGGVPSWENAGSGGGAKYFIIEDQKPSGIGGGTSPYNSFQTRDLNTVVYNNIEGASLDSNKFTLPAGIYRIKFSAPAAIAYEHKTRIMNVTDSTYPFYGTNERSAYYNQNRSFGNGVISIDSTKEFQIEHFCKMSYLHNGFGFSTNMGTEVYTQVSIEKLD